VINYITPPGSVDATCPIAKNNTPLMFAITKKDIESIRLLRKARASLTLKNNNDVNAEDVAEETKDKAVIRALDPDKEQSALAKLAALVVSFLLFIVAWVNDAANGVVRRMYGLNPNLNQDIDQVGTRSLVNSTSGNVPTNRESQAVNGPEQPSKAKFVENVDKFVKDNPTLERFFKGKKDYIKELAQKVADLEKDPSTPLGCKDLLPKTIKVSLASASYLLR
jgi:hypothetical protein